jgi:hypothetical protein
MNTKSYATAGGDLFADTTTHTGSWRGFRVIAAATFDTGTVGNIAGLTGVALPVNFEIPCSLTVIKLASGSIIAFTR